ncbi:hypothetical protein BGZ60DRAFT_563820 [Tricladium varicosporioides]|nr:hypothetical protein BGZ60DRAFT_563820 [Hymenoscyphus varicosporioides]
MHFTVATSIAFLVACTTVSGVVVPKGLSVRASTESYTKGVMTFQGTIHGVEYSGSGSIQDIYNDFKDAYPDVVASNNITANGHALVERAPDNKSDLNCCGANPGPPLDWGFAENNVIRYEGIPYLQQFHGLCGVGARSCVRVSCSYDSAIHLCNDNYFDIYPNCAYIASYATDLVDRCGYFVTRGWFHVSATCGQEFDTDNYNVIVRGDRC